MLASWIQIEVVYNIECISITSLANVHSNAKMNVYSKNSPSTLSSERAIARIQKCFPMSDHVRTHYKKKRRGFKILKSGLSLTPGKYDLPF